MGVKSSESNERKKKIKFSLTSKSQRKRLQCFKKNDSNRMDSIVYTCQLKMESVGQSDRLFTELNHNNLATACAARWFFVVKLI